MNRQDNPISFISERLNQSESLSHTENPINESSDQDITQFSTLSSLPISQIHESSLLNQTFEKKENINPSLHSLQCEIQLWQDAYKSAQENHSNKIKQLIRDQKNREDEIRKELKLKWDLKFEEINKDIHFVENELRWMIQSMIGRIKKYDSISYPNSINILETDTNDRHNQDELHSELLSLSDVLKDLVHGLETRPRSSSSSPIAHIINDFLNHFQSVLRNIQHQYDRTTSSNQKMIDLNQKYEITIKKLEQEMRQLTQQSETDRNEMLILQQEKAKIDLNFAKEKQSVINYQNELESLKKKLQDIIEKNKKSDTELKNDNKTLLQKKQDLEIEVQNLKLQLNNKTNSLESANSKIQELYASLSSVKTTSEDFRESNENLNRELVRLKPFEPKYEETSRNLNDEKEKRIACEKMIEELNLEIKKINSNRTQTISALEKELSEFKRTSNEIQQQLDHARKTLNQTENTLQTELLNVERNYRTETKELKEKIQKLEQEKEEIKTNSEKLINSEYQKNISRLVGVISAYNKNIKMNEDPVSQISSIFDQYEKRILDIQDKSFALEAGFKSQTLSYENNISELQYQIRSKQEQMNNLKYDIEQAVAKMEERVSNDAKIRGEERQRYKTVITVLQRQLENAGLQSNISKVEDIKSKKNNLTKYKKLITKLQNEKEILEVEKQKYQKSLTVHTQKNQELQQKLEETEAHLNEILNQKSELETEILRLKEIEIATEEQLSHFVESMQDSTIIKSQIEISQDKVTNYNSQNNKEDSNASQIIEVQLTELQEKNSELEKKYKHIKDKYIRQSLRQNELQNYILNLHRSGRISIDSRIDKSPLTPSTIQISPYQTGNKTNRSPSTVSTSPGYDTQIQESNYEVESIELSRAQFDTKKLKKSPNKQISSPSWTNLKKSLSQSNMSSISQSSKVSQSILSSNKPGHVKKLASQTPQNSLKTNIDSHQKKRSSTATRSRIR